jgi:V8-like Glu-specific endopeptidase
VRRLFFVLATIGVAVLLAGAGALGITGGSADTTDRYPYVGALLWPKGFGDGTYAYCTGTLISPTVFLTAAHCHPKTGDAVTFDANYNPKSSSSYSICLPRDCTDTKQDDYPFDGTFYADPNGSDVAVVVFERAPLGNITPPNLPTRHLLDDLKSGKGASSFTAVGYGASLEPNKQAGGRRARLTYSDKRAQAVTEFNTHGRLGRTDLRLSQKGGAGTCDGDSGGPNFVGEYPYPNNRPTIASITISGDKRCQRTNVTLRLDTASASDSLRCLRSLPYLDADDYLAPEARNGRVPHRAGTRRARQGPLGALCARGVPSSRGTL